MGIGEVVGGVSLVGLAVLVGIALNDDSAPEIITSDTSPFVFAAGSTTTTSTTSTTPSTLAAVATTTPAPSPTTTAAPALSAAPTSPAASTTTLIPPAQRSGIAMRVLNGGAPARAATMMTEVLRGVGFAPVGAADAAAAVGTTQVIFAPGRELDAATVNDVVRARPENVVPASADDPNWSAFGANLAVLVVLGPAGT